MSQRNGKRDKSDEEKTPLQEKGEKESEIEEMNVDGDDDDVLEVTGVEPKSTETLVESPYQQLGTKPQFVFKLKLDYIEDLWESVVTEMSYLNERTIYLSQG